MNLRRPPQLPVAPAAIQKGVPLKDLLNPDLIDCLASNICYAYPAFDVNGFCRHAADGLAALELMPRAQHIATVLHRFLPAHYSQAIAILGASLTPAQTTTEQLGLAGFFYLPHSFFIATYGLSPTFNQGHDPFDDSLTALRALTTRFTAEFAIRPFLIQQQDRMLATIATWLSDPNPHIRRLCSEGTRPKLPWGKRLPALIADPRPTLPILEALKNDPSLYVRRSVANHLGDIAKDHPELVYSICDAWLKDASNELRWVIRHALRHPANKGAPPALALRVAAKAISKK